MKATRMCRFVMGDPKKLPKEVCRRRYGHKGPCDLNGWKRPTPPSRRREGFQLTSGHTRQISGNGPPTLPGLATPIGTPVT
jgi:hypothetical protein